MLFRLCEFFPEISEMMDHTTNEQSFSTFKNIVAEHQIKNLPNLKGTSLTLSLPKKQRSLKPESDAPPIYLAVARRVISAAGSEGGGARVWWGKTANPNPANWPFETCVTGNSWWSSFQNRGLIGWASLPVYVDGHIINRKWNSPSAAFCWMLIMPNPPVVPLKDKTVVRPAGAFKSSSAVCPLSAYLEEDRPHNTPKISGHF